MFSDDTIRFYDAMYADKDYGAEASQVLDVVWRTCPSARTLLDVACGTGAHLSAFANAGMAVAGIDLMPGMVDAAVDRLRRSGSADGEVDVRVGDLRQFDFGRSFDVVTCLFSSIGYAGSVDGLRESIACMSRHVNPGGVVVVEPFYPPSMWLAGRIGHDVVELDDLTVVRLARSSREGDVAVIDFHHAAGTPEQISSWDEHHELLLADAGTYCDAVAAAGLVPEFDPDGFSFRGGGRGLVVGRSASGQ